MTGRLGRITGSIALALLYARSTARDGSAPQSRVLVHGAWVGERTWEPVAEILRTRGHAVHDVSLKGFYGRRYRADSSFASRRSGRTG